MMDAKTPIRIRNPRAPEERVLPAKRDSSDSTASDVRRVLTQVGGNSDDRLERDPKVVRIDVARDRICQKTTQDDYGVVFTDNFVDVAAADGTEELRAAMAARRRPSHTFTRGDEIHELLEGGGIALTSDDVYAA